MHKAAMITDPYYSSLEKKKILKYIPIDIRISEHSKLSNETTENHNINTISLLIPLKVISLTSSQ